jgi:hypothetical protein
MLVTVAHQNLGFGHTSTRWMAMAPRVIAFVHCAIKRLTIHQQEVLEPLLDI